MRIEEKVVLDIEGVIEMTTLSQSTIYALAKRGEFPKQTKIGPNRVVWRRSDVVDWLESKLQAA